MVSVALDISVCGDIDAMYDLIEQTKNMNCTEKKQGRKAIRTVVYGTDIPKANMNKRDNNRQR